MVSEPKSPFNRPPETLLGHGVNFRQLSGMPFIAQPLPRSMSTLRMMRSLGEIENYRSQMEVPEVPKDPCLLLDMCIRQWNKLNKVQLAGAHTAGCGKEDRKAIHLWFHQIASPWCDKLGHTSPSTCLDFIVPEPETQYNKDTKHRMLEAWLAWVLVQQSEKEILAMIPDFMLFLRLLCKVYHTQGPEYHGPCRRSAAFGGGFRLAAAAPGHMHGGSKENQPLEPGDKFDSGAHARSRSMTGISLKKMSRRNNHCKHPAVSEPPALCSQMMRLTNCHDEVLSPGTLAKNLLKPRMVCMHVTCYFTFKQLEKFISEQGHDHPLTNADERAVSKVSVRFFLYYYSPFRASERLARMLAAQQSWIWVSFTNRCTKPTIWFFKFKS